MKFTLRGVNMSLSPSLEVYAREKLLRSVERRAGLASERAVIGMDVELKRETSHHRKGELWRAVVNVRLTGDSFFAEARAAELHEAIDFLQEELERELDKQKGRFRARFLRGARRAREFLRFHRLARFFRKGRRLDEGS